MTFKSVIARILPCAVIGRFRFRLFQYVLIVRTGRRHGKRSASERPSVTTATNTHRHETTFAYLLPSQRWLRTVSVGTVGARNAFWGNGKMGRIGTAEIWENQRCRNRDLGYLDPVRENRRWTWL